MQDQSTPQTSQKKFEIIQQWHRNKPNQKIYKIHLYMISNMIKAEQKLRIKYQRPPSMNNIPVNAYPRDRQQQRRSEQDLMDGFGDDDSNAAQEPNPPQRPQPIQQPQQNIPQQKPIRIFQDFSNRGKFQTLRFHFNRSKQRITIIISQDYFINELKCKQFDLCMVYQSFTRIWQQQYINILQAFIKYSKDFKAHEIIKLEFVAIDILGVTFDIAYNNKVRDSLMEQKRFRFRYSPFEFRQNPFFEQRSTEQIMSYVQIHQGNINTISHQDFYTSMRLGFVDDINNNNNDLWRRMINRFWVFYQLHCLNRGMSEFQQFNKKALGRVHFHSIRMKKFQLIFPFQLLNRSIIEQRKQSTLYMTFYLQDKDIYIGENSIDFKMTVNLVEYYGVISYEQKRQLISRLKREDAFNIIEKSPQIEPNQLFEFYMTLRFDDKIARAFAKLETIVSFFVDKVAFNDPRSTIRSPNMQDNDSEKTIEIYSRQWYFRENQYLHTHQLCIELKHKYLNIVGQGNAMKAVDEVQFVKLIKKKRKWHEKQKKDEGVEKCQLPLHQEFKKYISQILKAKPLRQCYHQIISFIQNIVTVIYKPFDENNYPVKLQTRETLLAIAVGNIMRLLQLGNQHSRRSQITIHTEQSELMVKQEDEQQLLAEVSFSIKDLKIYWIKRLPEGYIVVRVFENRLQVVKDISYGKKIEIDWGNIETTSNQVLRQLRNILLKQFATLQNMMV